jgi:hypothetical protein
VFVLTNKRRKSSFSSGQSHKIKEKWRKEEKIKV